MTYSAKKARKAARKNLEKLENHLSQTWWAKGGQIMATRGDNRTVASWPGATPGQIRAGAKKLLDVMRGNARKMRRGQAAAATPAR